MKTNEELKRSLEDVLFQFEKGRHDLALRALEKSGKLIVTSLNAYNKKHKM